MTFPSLQNLENSLKEKITLLVDLCKDLNKTDIVEKLGLTIVAVK